MCSARPFFVAGQTSVRPTQYCPNMVRTPFSLFDTGPILGVRKPSTFLGLPSISTHPSSWTASPAAKAAPSYPYMNARPRYLRRSTTQSAKSISALETSFSPSKTIEALRMHRWSGASPAQSPLEISC